MAVLEFLEKPGQDGRALGALDATAGNAVLYAPQYATGGGYQWTLSVTNLESVPASVSFQFFNDEGNPKGTARVMPIAAKGKILISDGAFFGDFGPSLSQGYVEIRSSGPLLAGSVGYSGTAGHNFSTEIPLVSGFERRLVLGHLASNADFYTGIAAVNPSLYAANVRIEVFDHLGQAQVSGDFAIPPRGRISSTLTSLFPSLAGRDLTGGYVQLTADRGIASCGVFGAYDLTVLSALPAQVRLVR